jgi:hypothetical protein
MITGSNRLKETRRTQVYVKTAFETVRFEFTTIKELEKQVENRWGLQAGNYRLHPKPREEQSGVGYRLLPLVNGGHNSDDDDDEGDSWENQPRFPDQPNFGPRDLWDKAKFWGTRTLARENPEMSDRQLLQSLVNSVKQNGWHWLACLYLDNAPNEIEKRLAEGIPMSPNWRTIRDSMVEQQTNMTLKDARLVVHRSIILQGWATYVGWYQNMTGGEAYQELVVRDFLEREQYVYPRKTPEQLDKHLAQHWTDVRTLYEQERIRNEWKDFQKQKIAEQKAQAKAKGEEYEWDIDDDQGVEAITKQWVHEMLAPEPEDPIEEATETLDESVEQTIEDGQESEENELGDQQLIEETDETLDENAKKDELEENSASKKEIPQDLNVEQVEEEEEKQLLGMNEEEESTEEEEVLDLDPEDEQAVEEAVEELKAFRSEYQLLQREDPNWQNLSAAEQPRKREDAYESPRMKEWRQYGPNLPRDQIPEHLRDLWEEEHTVCRPVWVDSRDLEQEEQETERRRVLMLDIQSQIFQRILASKDPKERAMLWRNLINQANYSGDGLSREVSKMYLCWFRTACLNRDAALEFDDLTGQIAWDGIRLDVEQLTEWITQRIIREPIDQRLNMIQKCFKHIVFTEDQQLRLQASIFTSGQLEASRYVKMFRKALELEVFGWTPMVIILHDAVQKWGVKQIRR